MALRIKQQLGKFKRDERGAFSIFIVTMFTTLILIGGAAVDLVRYEAVRSSIQYNLDRAVLAAASMRQTKTPLAVVTDYMNKVDTLATFAVTMDDAGTSVSATGRRVSAVATADISTYFLRIAGIDTLSVSASSKASEEIPNLEISLVVDVSGSMDGTKLDNLKIGANAFIDELVNNSNPDSITTMSIVPYATNVTLPDNMHAEYTSEGLHSANNCFVFPSGDYSTAAIDTQTPLRQLANFSYYGEYAWSTGHSDELAFDEDCFDETYSEILPFSTSPTALKAKINSLNATGLTATHIGTKWGVALLDPAAASVATNIGSSDANGRPVAYNTDNVIKVLVVMTDGSNTDHEDIKDEYRSGPSWMYHVTGYDVDEYCWYNRRGRERCEEAHRKPDTYYLYRPNRDAYYEVDGSDSENDLPGDEYALASTTYDFVDYQWTTGNEPEDLITALADHGRTFQYLIENDLIEYEDGFQRQLDWTETWETISLSEIKNEIGYNQSNYWGEYTDEDDADTQTIASCNAAAANNVLVFTIAFDAPESAETMLRSCAGLTGVYYDVDNPADIITAFSSIAITVQKLKLTQ